jgi:hypothetical protein
MHPTGTTVGQPQSLAERKSFPLVVNCFHTYPKYLLWKSPSRLTDYTYFSIAYEVIDQKWYSGTPRATA